MTVVSAAELKNHLIQGLPLIDVRSPSEFAEGSVPHSINIPVLDDLERHEVGLCYKKKGPEAAVRLGHQFVSGAVLESRRSQWARQISENPQTVITCFRGGLRSQSAQKFLQESGVSVARVDGGYKAIRNQLLEVIEHFAQPLVILSGSTGSGKTHLLNEISSFYPAIDLEGLAHHRGSAFGAWDIAQPAQADFENRFAVKLMQINTASSQMSQVPLLLEDESRMIGHRHIPEVFFTKMREAPVVLVHESTKNRIENIFVDYISSKLSVPSSDESGIAILAAYKNSVLKIKNKLGGLRAQELLTDLEACQQDFLQHRIFEKNKLWIEKLLVWYYDPMYMGSLEKRNPQVQFKGSRVEIKSYFQSLV